MKEPVPRLACLAATRSELKGPLRALRDGRRMARSSFPIETGTLYGVESVLVVTGVGPTHAAAAVERVLEDFTVSEVLLIGLAGGTRPGLETPDLVACTELWSPEHEESPLACSSPALVERARRTGLLSATGPSVTMSRVVCLAKDKLNLGRKFGAAVVEMEGASVLKPCNHLGVPALMVRAILDPAEISFPDTTPLLTGSRELRARALLSDLAHRPRDASVLFDLVQRSRACFRVLDQFARRYLAEIEAGR